MKNHALLQAQGLHARTGNRELLHAVDFRLEAGQLLGIVGPNGAGKTSLLRALLGWLPLRGGSVQLQGRALPSWRPPERARQLAYLAQGQQVHWPLPVRDVVALGRLPHGDARQPNGQAAIDAALHATGMQTFAERNVQSLSGGERARVLLARALAAQTPILLADEPLAALDPAQQLHCMALLRQQAAQGQGVAVVLHDLGLASRFCSHVLLMAAGRSQHCGTPEQVLNDAALAQHFGIEALRLQRPDGTCIIPWQTVQPASGPCHTQS